MWVSNKTYPSPTSGGEPFTLVLMDTEGIDAPDQVGHTYICGAVQQLMHSFRHGCGMGRGTHVFT